MTSTKYAPGEVTPEQLEQFKQTYEAARQEERILFARYEAAYRVYSDALFARKRAEDVYKWAQHGMVQEHEAQP